MKGAGNLVGKAVNNAAAAPTKIREKKQNILVGISALVFDDIKPKNVSVKFIVLSFFEKFKTFFFIEDMSSTNFSFVFFFINRYC